MQDALAAYKERMQKPLPNPAIGKDMALMRSPSQAKMLWGRKAPISQLGASTTSQILRSTATLQSM